MIVSKSAAACRLIKRSDSYRVWGHRERPGAGGQPRFCRGRGAEKPALAADL